MELQEVVDALNQVTPTGSYSSEAKAWKKEVARSQLHRSSLYHIRLPEGIGADDIATAVDSKMGQSQWLVERKSRKSGRMMEIDLLECIARIEVTERDVLDEMVPEARSQDGLTLELELREGTGAHVRPEMVVNYLLEKTFDDALICMRRGFSMKPPVVKASRTPKTEQEEAARP